MKETAFSEPIKKLLLIMLIYFFMEIILKDRFKFFNCLHVSAAITIKNIKRNDLS